MASMNTRLNIEKLDGNIVQKHRGLKQVGLKQLGSKQLGFKQLGVKQVRFKQLGLGVEIGVHEVHDEKHVCFEVKIQGAQGNHEAKVFQVSNNDTAVAQRRLEDNQPEEKTNTDGLRSTQQCIKSEVAKHLGVTGIHQHNGLVDETNVTLFAKVVFYRNMGFNESGKYKKTFIGYGVGTGSMQALHGFEFEVELQENIDQGASLQEVQSQDLMDYHDGCRKCSDDNDGYYWGYTPAKGNVLGMEIARDQSGYTLRVSQSRFYKEKLGILSGDCDVKKLASGHVYMRLEDRSIRWSARYLT
nr:zinc finger, CCHC-type [Tanacetum cinerariifolium]